jgi:osmotically-inducible protein OsmY
MNKNQSNQNIENYDSTAVAVGLGKTKKWITQGIIEADHIKDALRQYAGIEKDWIVVIVKNDNILLDGHVNTLSQREDATKVVRSLIKHPVKIDNNLKVDIEYAGADVFEY